MLSPDGPEPYEVCPEKLSYALFGLSLAVVLWVRLSNPDLTWFSTDMSRDLARSFEWLGGNPSSYLGPEIGHGPRMPGPLYYWFLALVWKVTHWVPTMLVLIHTGIILSLLWFLKVVVRPLGRTPTLVFWLTFALLPIHVLNSRMLWSPSLVVPLNLLTLIFAARYLASQHRGWLSALAVLGWLSLQIHLTAFVGPTVCLAYLCWKERRPFPFLGYLGFLTLYLTLVWGGAQGFARMGDVVQRDYGFLPGLTPGGHYSWSNLFHSLSSHLFIVAEPLRWDELYTVTFQLGPDLLGPGTFVWIERFLVLRWVVVLLVLVALLVCLGRALKGRAAPLEQAVLLWFGLALVGVVSYKFGQGTVPYRYGFSFYPFQFLVLALALAHLNRSARWRSLAPAINLAALGLALTLFAGNAFFLLQSYRVSEISGSVSETGVLEEPTLRRKLRLIASAGPARAETFLGPLHGPLANRVRRAEFYHWTQARWTGGLYQSLEKTGSLPQGSGQQHWFVGAKGPVSLSKRDLPSEVSFQYLDEQGHDLGTVRPDSSLLLPCLQAPEQAKTVRVSFQLEESAGRKAAICFDDHPYNRALSLAQVRANGEPAEFQSRDPRRLNQRVVLLDHPGPLQCQLEFQLFQFGTYSRLDIFRWH